MKLALFDLDGTLFDTRNVNYYAYQEALKKFGFDLDYNYYTNECNGRHYTEFLPIITNNAGDNIYEQIHKIKKNSYVKYLNKVIVNEKLFDIIVSLKSYGYKTAVVTTASKHNTMDILKYFNKVELFDLIVTPDDYEKTKPEPDSFLYAMNYFNSSADNTLIFEDSLIGLEAAKKTKSTVFKVEQFTRCEHEN